MHTGLTCLARPPPPLAAYLSGSVRIFHQPCLANCSFCPFPHTHLRARPPAAHPPAWPHSPARPSTPLQIEAAEHAQNWTNGMLDFHRVLSNLSEVVSEHAKRRSGSSSSSSSSGSDSGSEEEEEEEQQKPQKQQGKKRKAAGGSGGGSSSAGEATAAATAPPAAAAPPKRVKAATHIGRFKKREAAKMVKGYSEHDLAAILGGDPFAAAAAAVPEVRAQQPQQQASSSGYDSDSEASGSDEEGGSSGGEKQQGQRQAGSGKGGSAADALAAAAEQQPLRPPMIVVRRPMPASCRPAQPPTPQESRQPGWWQVCFHRAAGPKGVGAQAAAAAGGTGTAINVHGFSEQDQTNLYNLAHVSGRALPAGLPAC